MGKRRSANSVLVPPVAAGTARDNHQSTPTWAFDADVAACYDDMLARSIPQLPVMRTAVTTVARRFARPGTPIVDLGTSLGGALAPLWEAFGDRNTFVGVDNSAPMLAIARERFAEARADGTVEFLDLDLRSNYPPVVASVTLAILTMQFIPIEHRQQLLRRAYEHTLPGGALIIVDKVLGGTAALDDVMVDAYHTLKADEGYSAVQIGGKRRALEGIQVPLTAAMNEAILRNAGFSQIDCFWRWMNFAGWVAVREPDPLIAAPTTRAIRGAILVEANTPEAIHAAARELMQAIVDHNDLDPDEIVSAFFTLTTDLDAAFPAKAVRQMGWSHIALLCATEIPVPGAMSRCLRVLLHCATTRSRASLRSVYLHGAERLLRDDCEPER